MPELQMKNRSSRRSRRCRFGVSHLSTGSFSNAAARAALSGPASDEVAVRGELSVLGMGLPLGQAARFARWRCARNQFRR